MDLWAKTLPTKRFPYSEMRKLKQEMIQWFSWVYTMIWNIFHVSDGRRQVLWLNLLTEVLRSESLPFLWPRSYVTAVCFCVPIFLFKAIRMSSNFTVMVFGRINGVGEMPRSSWRSESVKNLQVLLFSPKPFFSSSNVTPVSGVSFFF